MKTSSLPNFNFTDKNKKAQDKIWANLNPDLNPKSVRWRFANRGYLDQKDNH